MGNDDTVQNSTIYDLLFNSKKSASGTVEGSNYGVQSISALQNTTMGNSDTVQNSTIYNLQNTTMGNSDTVQNSTIYNNLQNTTVGNSNTFQGSTMYNLQQQGTMPTNTNIASGASCSGCTVYPGTYSTLPLLI